MQLEYKKEDDVLRILISGDIDHHNCKGVRQSIDALIDETMPSKLILDFSKVDFMDSSGVAIILGRYKRMKEEGGTTEVVNVKKIIRRILEISAVDKLIKVS